MCWWCDHPGATQDDYQDHLLQLIADCGWAIQAVEREGRHPPWAYTVGLTSRQMPELVVTGMDPDPAARLLNSTAKNMQARGVPGPGKRIRLEGGKEAEVVTVAVPDAHLRVAAGLYGETLKALQLVIPDAAGRWPWDATYSGVPGGQPVLGPRQRKDL